MKDSKRFRWLMHQSKYSIRVLWIIPLVCIVSSFCHIGISMIFKGYMDIASSESSMSFVQMTIFSITVIVVFALTNIASSVLEGYSYSKIEKGIRTSLIEKIVQKYLLAINKMHTAEIQNRLTSDVATISDFFNQLFGQMTLCIFTSVFAIIFLFILNWKITLLFLILIPLLTLLITVFSPKLQKAAEIDSKNEDANRSYMQEVLTLLPLFQVYSMGKNIRNYTQYLYDKKKASKVKLSFLEGSFGFLNSLTSFGIFIITSAVGAYFVVKGENTVGDLVAMIQLSNYIMIPLTEAPKFLATYNSTLNSVKRIREIENIDNRNVVKQEDKLPLSIDSINLNHLSFEYETGKPILSDISAVFPKDKIIGIIGKSGNGKSTLIKLILGLYIPENREMIEMRKDGESQNYYNYKGIASYVPSENFVFSGTIKDNICMSRLFEKDKFERACKAANIDQLVSSFELKEKEEIKESGNNLSMGQKQRLAIARAIYADTSVIILDEPTANLDIESINLFKEAIQNLSKGKICIIVTHDNNIASICDTVYRLEKKNLILLEKGGNL